MWEQIKTNLIRHRHEDGLQVLIAALISAIMYAIGAVANNRLILSDASKRLGNLDIVPSLLMIVMMVLALFSISFLLYLNSLLIGRRDQEIGLYRLLGLSGAKLGLIVFLESVMIGIVGLFVGALLGLILSPLLGMVLIRLMALHTPIGFMFSLSALMDVLTLMGVVYLLVGAINAIYVRSPLRQFIRQQDVPAPPKPQTRWRFWVGIFGFLLLVGSLLTMLRLLPIGGRLMRILSWLPGPIVLPLFLLLVIGALLLGLFLVFAYFLPGLVAWYQKRHEMQTHNASGISRHLIIKRLQGNAHSLWLTTLLCAITITMLGSSVMLFQYNQDLVLREIPTTIVASGVGVDNVTDIFKQAKVKPKQAMTIPSKLVYAEIRLRNQIGEVRKQPGVYNVVALRDYQRAAKIQRELGPIRLHSQEAKLMLPTRSGFRPVGARRNPNRAIILPGSDTSLRLTQTTNLFPTGSNNYFDRGLLVTNRTFDMLNGTPDRLYMAKLPKTKAAKRALTLLQHLGNSKNLEEFVNIGIQQREGDDLTVTDRASTNMVYWRNPIGLQAAEQNFVSTLYGFLLFLILLLSGVFVVATGSILLLKQVIAVRQEIRHFQILKQLGMDPHQIRVTLYRQAAVIFAVPLICGILIALCVISVMTNYLDNPPSRYLGVMIGIYAAFDWLFYEATVHVMVRMVDSPIGRWRTE